MLGLIIRFAKIGTYLDQVVDVFYVTERDGSKPTVGRHGWPKFVRGYWKSSDRRMKLSRKRSH